MGSVNTSSVRDELKNFETMYAELTKDNTSNEQTHCLIKGLFMALKLVVSVFMEKQTKKTSKNSSLPSSQTDEDETGLEDTDNKKRRQQREKSNTHQSDNTRTIETVTVIEVAHCQHCGESLCDEACIALERRTMIDIIFEKQITHVDAEIKSCPSCHQQTKGDHPKTMQGPKQYGLGVKAYIIQMLITQMVSLKRLKKQLGTLIGEWVSEAVMLKYILQLHHALEPWEEQATEEMLLKPAINVDETSLQVDKKKQWIHGYSSGDITLKFLHKKRGREAMQAIHIIPRYGGVIIHDCWGSYLAYERCLHGLCGSHLLRELTFIIQANDYRWAKNIKILLQEACRTINRGKKKKLSKKAYARLQRCYRNTLTRGKKEMPAIIKPRGKKRGRIAKSDAHNLWERLKKYESAVLRFALDPNVTFTNNRSERDFRMAKVKQKVSGCFRTEIYAKAYCRISSYLQTMERKGYSAGIAIQMALTGELYRLKV